MQESGLSGKRFQGEANAVSESAEAMTIFQKYKVRLWARRLRRVYLDGVPSTEHYCGTVFALVQAGKLPANIHSLVCSANAERVEFVPHNVIFAKEWKEAFPPKPRLSLVNRAKQWRRGPFKRAVIESYSCGIINSRQLHELLARFDQVVF